MLAQVRTIDSIYLYLCFNNSKMDIEKLMFPIGEWRKPDTVSPEALDKHIETISSFSDQLLALVLDKDEALLNNKYRPDGWTARQVIHHCADSHMNAFVRTKLAMTEDNPTIKPYNEAEWAVGKDYDVTPITASLQIISGVHQRWAHLLVTMSPEDFSRTYFHPEMDRKVPLDEVASMYAWHCKHHLEHVKNAVESEGKYN